MLYKETLIVFAIYILTAAYLTLRLLYCPEVECLRF